MMRPSLEMTWDYFNCQKEVRLRSMAVGNEMDKGVFFNLIKSQRSQESYAIIKNFSRQIERHDYNHDGLSKAQYLAHPYRVATLLVEQLPEVDDSFIKLALCHNVIEVSELSAGLINDLGSEMLKYVEVLTVDRSRQWDWDYKKGYYEKIGLDRITRTIKVFDKLDNLYILSENSDSKVKIKYLEEITDHLMPFVVSDFPNLKGHFETIIKFNYQLIKNIV